MKVRLLNDGGYETCTSMTFPCEVEATNVEYGEHPASFSIVYVTVEELVAHGGTPNRTESDELVFCFGVGPLGELFGIVEEAELIEE